MRGCEPSNAYTQMLAELVNTFAAIWRPSGDTATPSVGRKLLGNVTPNSIASPRGDGDTGGARNRHTAPAASSARAPTAIIANLTRARGTIPGGEWGSSPRFERTSAISIRASA